MLCASILRDVVNRDVLVVCVGPVVDLFLDFQTRMILTMPELYVSVLGVYRESCRARIK